MTPSARWFAASRRDRRTRFESSDNTSTESSDLCTRSTAGARGNATLNVDPKPSPCDSTHTRPLCSSTKARTIDNPKPKAFVFARREALCLLEPLKRTAGSPSVSRCRYLPPRSLLRSDVQETEMVILPAGVRELDAVGHQIPENLLDSHSHAKHPNRMRRESAGPVRASFLRLWVSCFRLRLRQPDANSSRSG